MLRPILVLSFLVCVYCPRCYSQKDTVPDWRQKQARIIVKTDLFFPLYFSKYKDLIFTLTVEKPIAKRHSLQLTYMGVHTKYLSPGLEERSHSLFIIPEYKFFVSKKRACSGYYVGASALYDHEKDILSFHSSSQGDRNYYSYYNAYGFGLMNGFQYYFFKHLTVDVMAGAIAFVEIDSGDPDEYWDFFPRVAVNLGYKF